MRTRIKLCGMRHLEEVESALRLDIDALGFILVPNRKRTVSPSQAAKLISRLPGEITSVGVMMNPTLEEVRDVGDQVAFDRIQLHGDESPEFCAQVKEILGVSITKVLHVQASSRVKAALYANHVDTLLLDSGRGKQRGGMGTSFPWNKIPVLQKEWREQGVNVWVAGGLHPENVGDLMQTYRPDGVDTSSGIELAGRKSAQLMARFVERVRFNERCTKAL